MGEPAPIYTVEQLTQYRLYLEKRLKESASAWMKSEVRKAIEECDRQLAINRAAGA